VGGAIKDVVTDDENEFRDGSDKWRDGSGKGRDGSDKGTVKTNSSKTEQFDSDEAALEMEHKGLKGL